MDLWLYGAAAVLGGLVGVAELLLRYRDSPTIVFTRVAAWAYLGFNAMAAVTALFLIDAFDLSFGQTGDTQVQAMQVMVAGFGSAAFFRTNLFVAKVGEENIGAGPSLVLTSLLAVADRAVDRAQAELRAKNVAMVMGEVSFDLAKQALVSFALTATVSVAPKDATELRTAVDALASESAKFGDEAKAYILGLMLIDIVGFDVLKQSIETLGANITRPPEVPATND